MQCGEAVVPVSWLVSVESRKKLVTHALSEEVTRTAGALTARSEQQDKYTTKGPPLDAEVVVSGVRDVGRGASMISARDADTERSPTRTGGSTSHADQSISNA